MCAWLRADYVMASVVAISVGDFSIHHASHQITLFGPTHITNKIHNAAYQLFDGLRDGINPIMKSNRCLSPLQK